MRLEQRKKRADMSPTSSASMSGVDAMKKRHPLDLGSVISLVGVIIGILQLVAMLAH